ncbi:two-component response regulator-like APRR7 isoform X2 [Pistacia vera]|uniref:two-component response regulator-like APRR7 isoform X2 n=1 Tax=Pistacia vera TaxID=55513 RepID=UPI0012635BD9|nr:two-component response regulator-like APRR7 isoform X2 [Pistacia vera]
MKVDGTRDKELQELNHHLQDGSKRDMVVGEQGSHDDGQLKDNKNAENVKDGCGGTVQASAVLQVSQQQPQAAMVCWERFLHLRSLKVLLVENDDSTRYVVAALLRNCSYEVTEATNGLQAWKILEDLTNHINIVLTEVAMPCLSGIGLLCKIMNHKTRKNVPVIMMSSLDSISLVFKCFSKGAVDFLVKPIRKNELKNLWQHVWRRCHSSSGSGSESGTQTQKSVKSKSVEKSDNNTGSNDEEDNGSIGLNVGDGSDDGSGTQSSWTKQVKFDGPGPISPCGQVAECPDSTCAQVIHLNAEVSDNRRIPVTEAEECHEHEEKLDNISMGRDLNLGVHRGLDLQLEYSSEVPIKCVGTKQNNHLEVDSSKFFEPIDRGQLDLKSESPSSKMKYEAANLIGVITKITDPEKNNAEYEAQNRISEILDDNSKVIKDSVELPSLELSLKRLRGVKDIGMTVQVDRNVLRRSDSSAFSRYNATSNTNKGPGGNVASASQVDNSLEVAKKGAICDIQSHSSGDILHQSLNADKGESVMAASSLAQPWDEDQELQIQHLTHHYDNCHHLIYNLQQQQLPHDHDLLSLKKMAATVPHCGSSNALGGLVEGNARNHSVNGSTSGSNHGSNGQNGSSTAMNAGGMNIESDNGVADKSESGDASGSGCGTGSGSGSGSRVDQNKFSQREAALTKFRQKRKERCYRKRVRYQSRKRLAEQRLGQFVRQTANKNTSRDADS